MTGERERSVCRGTVFLSQSLGRTLWVSAPLDSGMPNLVELLFLSIVVLSREEPHPLQWSQAAWV